ncbi:hemolysin-type calcium-binding region [Ectocarpus siliculosus]|uniref:Hemolysin-type calcium-binding region n=1 Tax=Ectocarpus siliculosus TaxID=2880 RepID=D7FIH4_ECTSI|nr:hemolysin-type calcium-binding region [Ectocarpus siliculosus]|eukprot:CBJ28797.1 hemolysin-type calcium-binding region [Ectocarpus siliculosus]
MAAGKLDSDGAVLWSWQEGTTDEDALSDAAATDDGGVVFAGFFNGTLNGVASEGLGDFIAIKFDSDGTEEWRWQDGTEMDEGITTCSKTADGNVVLTGSTLGDWVETNTGLWALVAVKLDVTDGSVIWQYQAGVPSQSVVSRGSASRADGSIVIGGVTDGDWDGELTGFTDFFTVALDEDGSELWRFQDGSLLSSSSAWGVAALSDGSVVLAGTTDGNYAGTNAGAQDFAVVKLTEEGVLDWTWQDGTPYDESFEGVATGIDGTSMVFAGYTFGTWAAAQAEDEDDMDAVGMSMDGDGTLLWTYQAGTTNHDNFIGVDVGPDGAALLAGFSAGTWEDPTADFYADFAGVLIETGAVPATPAPADDIVITPSTPFPVTGTSGDTSEGSCGDGESFLITSDVLPVVQGCYQQTTLSFDDGGQYEEYTVSGLTEWEHITMFGSSSAFADDDGDEATSTAPAPTKTLPTRRFRWTVGALAPPPHPL